MSEAAAEAEGTWEDMTILERGGRIAKPVPSTSASTPQGKARFAERLRSERLLQRYI